MSVLWLTILLVAIALTITLCVPSIRRQVFTRPIFKAFRRVIPGISDTERDALSAGSVWWEGQLFCGNPDWQALHAIPPFSLTAEEQAFLDNEVAHLCAMIDDWQVTHELGDMPEAVWSYIKDAGFLSLIIPKEYGGLGFSAQAHSAIITALSTRSSALSVTVMVPNSLGPAELLLEYGTPEQKSHYLPRLARGQDIPAFALTSPWAGSDAAAIPDYGRVCHGEWEGETVLGMQISWDKRYITLAPVCTLLGLAFRLYDPDGLLGDEPDIGITCALIPTTVPGVETGRRHFPLNAMFMNGPTRGENVFIPLSFIIGGPDMAGYGWRMLMESLAAGRSISLPASFCGMAQLTSRSVGAYAAVRHQFGIPIGRFEGVQEALARIGGHTYLMDAARHMTAVAVDEGERPSVVSAIVKYHLTERGRHVVNDGMDIIGGKGICLGPSNFLGRAYQQLPVGITVEGANILTRSLIIFGQGAIRCHPHILDEMDAALDPDAYQGLIDFDHAFWSHVRYSIRNIGRAFWWGVTASRFIKIKASTDANMHVYYRQSSRYSAAFAVLADVAMLVLGGSLKTRERLSARLGDILSQLYLISTVLKRFEDEGRQPDDAPFVHWAIQDAMTRMHDAFDGVLRNFPNRPLAAALRLVLFPWGLRSQPPSDEVGHSVARALTQPGPCRNRLTPRVVIPDNADEPVAALEAALHSHRATKAIRSKIRAFEKSGKLDNNPRANVRDIAHAVYDAGGLSDDEYAQIRQYNELLSQVIAVDDFDFDLRPKHDRDYGDATRHPEARDAQGQP